jgi:hypothetical protein
MRRSSSSDCKCCQCSDTILSHFTVTFPDCNGNIQVQIVPVYVDSAEVPAVAFVSEAMRLCVEIKRQIESELRVRYGRRVTLIEIHIGTLCATLLCESSDRHVLAAQVVGSKGVPGWPQWRHPP